VSSGRPPVLPDSIEIAFQGMLGMDPGTDPLPPAEPGADPVRAMEESALVALRQPPCVVSFSGGRDSSTVLALAVRVARREGLPLPVPVTLRFPEAEGADESSWQERVIDHLGLDEWERIELTDELDFVGPVAQDVMRRHGVVFPPNAHFHVPVAERARGGSMLTGAGGDQVMIGRRRRQTITRRAAPTPKDVLRAAYRRLPDPVRRQVTLRRRSIRKPWLTPAGLRATVDRILSMPPQPRPRDAQLRWMHRGRYLTGIRDSLALIAADRDAIAIHPFMEPGPMAAFAQMFGPGGIGDRSTAMRALFADLLPPELLERPRKAHFADAYCTQRLRDFAAGWSGGGVDRAIVDEARLREMWQRAARANVPHPSDLFKAPMLLQAAWLHGERHAAPVASS